MTERIVFDLRDIKMQLQGERICDLVDMLVGAQIVHRWCGKNPQDYTINISRDRKEDTPFSVALVISATDSHGREAHGYRYPSSTDSFYDSCVDIINMLRRNIKCLLI